MLWVYDEAIVRDLSDCINPDGGASTTVKLMGQEGIMGVIAQIQQDKVTFPALFLQRNSETPIDSQRFNFTRLHKGVPAAYGPERNDIYLEKMIPIKLTYDLHVITTDVADMDEIIRELIFRYTSMYYLMIEVPYESKRKIRFGMSINPDTNIRRESGNTEYVSTGKLYESVIELDCQGAVMLSYTPRHMEGVIIDKAIQVK